MSWLHDRGNRGEVSGIGGLRVVEVGMILVFGLLPLFCLLVWLEEPWKKRPPFRVRRGC